MIRFFSILKLAVNSLTDNHFLIQIISIILFIAINLIAIVIFCGLFGKRYYSSLKNSDSIFSKSKKLANVQDDNVIKKESFIKSYIQVEWKMVARSPVLFCNTFLMALLWPIIIIILLVISFIEGSGEIDDFIVLIQQLDFSFNNSLVVLICLGVIIFLMIMNVSSVTSISRMGKDASFVKYIPLSSSIIVHIKIFWGVVLSMGILVVLSIISLIFGLLHWYDLIAILVLGFSVILLLNYIGVFIDLKKPYLNWDNEVAAVKSNLNVLLYVLIVFSLIGFFTILYFIVNYVFNDNSGYVLFGLVLLLSNIFNYIFYRYFLKPKEIVFVNIS